jgi:hypothetical protein
VLWPSQSELHYRNQAVSAGDINTDKNPAYGEAIAELEEGVRDPGRARDS